jgi:hypothetical protein
MAALSPDQFEANIKPRAILYFPEPELKTHEPHYFICIGQTTESRIITSCCTSQFNTVKNLIERWGYPPTTLVYIPTQDNENPFKKDTYINCNEFFGYQLSELWDLYLHNKLSFHGELPLDSFEQILIGMKDSDQIDEEIKDCLPNIDDL